MDRVCFFSSSDLLSSSYLELAEKRISEIVDDSPNDIESIIELWHIRKYFDAECRLKKWSDEDFEKFKVETSNYKRIVAKYFNNINKDRVKDLYESLDWTYKESFWDIIEQIKCFEIIDPITLKSIIETNINNLRYVLSNKTLVEKFKCIVKEVLLNEPNTTLILIDEFVTNCIDTEKHSYIPNNLSVEERERIVLSYLNSKEPNLNYVRLIVEAKNIEGKFILSPKTRLIAKNLAKKMNDDLLNDPRTCITNCHIKISFTDDNEILNSSIEDGYPSLKYGKHFIQSCSIKDKILYCGQVFDWIDENGMINLINKNSEVDGLEWILRDRCKTAYPNFFVFEQKNALSLYQLNGFCATVFQNGTTMEQIMESFFYQVLRDEFGFPGLKIILPKPNDRWVEKCRILFPELDNIARQYDTYIDEGEIDSEYMSMVKPQKMTNTKSFLCNKYCEINENNTVFGSILHTLFNKNSLLAHVDPYKDKRYYTFANLMEHETVYYNNYEDFQKQKINFLIENEIVEVEENGKIKYRDNSIISALKSIWEFGSCSYWHYDDNTRNVLDNMITKGWIKTDDRLLSRLERQYFSYYMDNSEFTNGYEYRNRYAHGCSPIIEDDNAHAIAYFTLLRLLIILVLKIYDDLWIARFVLSRNRIQ